MHVAVVTPPAEFITLDQAKAFLRVDGSEEDVLIQGLVSAAMLAVEAPDGYVRRAVGQQVLKASVYALPVRGRALALPFPPITAVNSITYIGPRGEELTVDPSIYELAPEGAIRLAYGRAWPQRRSQSDVISITFAAGYAAVPRPYEIAALMHVAAMYDNRDGSAPLPPAARQLLSAYRIPRV